MAANKTPVSGRTSQTVPAPSASTPDSKTGIVGVRERIKQVADEARSLSDLVDNLVNDPKLDELHQRGKSLLRLLGFKIE